MAEEFPSVDLVFLSLDAVLLMAPLTLSVPSCRPILMPLAERTVAYLADVKPCVCGEAQLVVCVCTGGVHIRMVGEQPHYTRTRVSVEVNFCDLLGAR